MSKISEFNSASNADTDREHEFQRRLLQALCSAVSEPDAAAEVGEILERLIAYTEAHCMSEELLMRLHSHEDYEDHVDDHLAILEMLNDIASNHALGNSRRMAAQVSEIAGFIEQHIATRDRRFAEFLRQEAV